jgi:hypothetical protein
VATTANAKNFKQLTEILGKWQFDASWEMWSRFPDFWPVPIGVQSSQMTEAQIARYELFQAEALCYVVASDLAHRFQRAIYNDGTAKERAAIVGSVLDEVVKRREQFGIKRFGDVIVIDEFHLELSAQLADLFELASRTGGVSFDELRNELSIEAENESGIRSRVDKLKKKLKTETRKAPFAISISTRSKRVTATIHYKSPPATETSPSR